MSLVNTNPHPFLPTEMWLHIFSYLGIRDLEIASRVCKLWNAFADYCWPSFLEGHAISPGETAKDLLLNRTVSIKDLPQKIRTILRKTRCRCSIALQYLNPSLQGHLQVTVHETNGNPPTSTTALFVQSTNINPANVLGHDSQNNLINHANQQYYTLHMHGNWQAPLQMFPDIVYREINELSENFREFVFYFFTTVFLFGLLNIIFQNPGI